MEPFKPVLKNICQSNTCRKDLSWSHFNVEPSIQLGVATWGITTVFHTWASSISIEIKSRERNFIE